jgi:hypothetical protein
MVAIVRRSTRIARDPWSTAIVPATAATGVIVRAITGRQTTTTVLGTTVRAIAQGTGQAIALEIVRVRQGTVRVLRATDQARQGIVQVHREAIVQARRATDRGHQEGIVPVRQEGTSRVHLEIVRVHRGATVPVRQGIVRVLALQGTGLEMGASRPGPALRIIGLIRAVRTRPVQRQTGPRRNHGRPRRHDQRRVALRHNKGQRRADLRHNKGQRRAGLRHSRDRRRKIDPLVLRGTNRRTEGESEVTGRSCPLVGVKVAI